MSRQEINDCRVIAFAAAEKVAFVCECADEECRRSVVLAPVAFISRREAGDPILHPGHESTADAPTRAESEFASARDGALVRHGR